MLPQSEHRQTVLSGPHDRTRSTPQALTGSMTKVVI